MPHDVEHKLLLAGLARCAPQTCVPREIPPCFALRLSQSAILQTLKLPRDDLHEVLVLGSTSVTGGLFSPATNSQVRSFVAGVTKRAAEKGSALFPRQELLQIANDLCLAISDFESFLDVLRQVTCICIPSTLSPP